MSNISELRMMKPIRRPIPGYITRATPAKKPKTSGKPKTDGRAASR